eukprot:TRINITY_DN18416_c0_g1_i2.p1 TRINITY_DN18416_c0_g1~~TRINITY_DN18416_c0_g1_i2.p1  ORF type:complete len:278 (+),score=53.18 TRINITY_DN18416_c0_g1_i2:77-835(+)
MAAGVLQVFVRKQDGDMVAVEIDCEATVGQLIEAAAAALGHPPRSLGLRAPGGELLTESAITVADAGLSSEAVLEAVTSAVYWQEWRSNRSIDAGTRRQDGLSCSERRCTKAINCYGTAWLEPELRPGMNVLRIQVHTESSSADCNNFLEIGLTKDSGTKESTNVPGCNIWQCSMTGSVHSYSFDVRGRGGSVLRATAVLQNDGSCELSAGWEEYSLPTPKLLRFACGAGRVLFCIDLAWQSAMDVTCEVIP